MGSIQEKRLYEELPVPEAVFRLAFPTVIGQIILVIYNMADTFFVGLTGEDAMLTAVTVCMPAFMILSAISNLFGVGGASVISRSLGAKEEDRARRASSFAFWGCLSVTALYCAASYFLCDLYVDLLGGTNPDVHRNAVPYLLCTVAAGGICTAAGVLFSHLIRSEGRSVHAGLGVALGGILNIILDPVFMFRVLPPGNEALGAAIATALSNAASCIYFIIVLWCIRKVSVLSFRPRRRAERRDVLPDIVSAGLPACIMTLFENLSYAVLDKQMSFAGLPMQAGIGVAKKLNMLAHSVTRGIAQGALPLIGYNYASGNIRRMRSSFRTAQFAAVGAAFLCTAANLVFAHELVGLFILGETVSLDYGTRFLRILCVGGPLSASAYTIISFFQAVGEGRKSLFLATLRKGFVDIPLMFLLGAAVPVYGIVAATPAADAVCCIAALILYLRFIRRLEREAVGKPSSSV